MSKTPPQLRERGLTLEDYLAHQSALRALQQSHAVWIVDETLGMRYCAWLQLCLSPTRRLVLSNDAGKDSDAHHRDNRCCAVSGPSSAPSIVLPLTPECRVDACASAMSSDEVGIRITFTSPPPTSAEDAPEEWAAAEASYFVVPITFELGTSTASLAQSWAAVLRSLCRPPPSAAAAAVPSTAPGVSGVPPPLRRHVDPSAAMATTSATLPAAVPAMTSVVANEIPAETVADGRPLRVSAVPATAPPHHTTAATTIATAPSARAGNSTAALSSTVPRTVATTGATTTSITTTAPKSLQLAPSSRSSAVATLTSTHDTCEQQERRGGVHLTQPSVPDRVAAWSARKADEPTSLHPLLLPTAATNLTPLDTKGGAHAADADDTIEKLRFQQLTTALRSRTRQAAQLAEHLRSSLSPGRHSHSQPSPVDFSAAVEEAADLDPERPPTMAHTSSGLVPAIRGLYHLSRATSSTDANDDVDVDAEAEGEGENVREVGARLELMAGVVDVGRGGGGGVRAGTSYANSADSPRPQAPRGGHVCNLGSLGPSCGDEEALRIYNQIHGSHSSCSSRLHTASGSSDGNA
jgi:hypothetical protein